MIHHPPHIRPRLRHVVMASIAAAAMVGVANPAAAARPSTSSDTIVAEAEAAIDAFDQLEAGMTRAEYHAYADARDLTAEVLADELGVSPDALIDEWSASSLTKQRALLAALSQLGVPYRSLASEPGSGFDCSGLTIWAFGAADVSIPRVSGDQINASSRVGSADAQPGDLVHYPGHVGIYVGEGSYVHSPYTGQDVEVTLLPDRTLSFGDVVDTDG